MSPPANAAAPQAAARVTAASLVPSTRRGYACWTLAIVVAALWLRLPALEAGLFSDDYLQAAMLSGAFPAPRAAWSLYDFGGRQHGDVERLRAAGFLPWWSAPDLKLAMFRPLASVLIAADDAFVRDAPGLRHVHSALWLCVLLCGVAALLRALLPPVTALLGLLLFAAEPALSLPLGWLPNRAALTACAFAVWGLCAYLRFRRGGHRAFAWWAGLAFALAVLAGEYAVPALAFVVAYECTLASESLATRAACAACALLPALAVIGAGALLGFGTRASGMYLSPLLEPSRYARASVLRLPALAAELTCGIPTAFSFRPQASLLGRDGVAVIGSALAAGVMLLLLGRFIVTRADRELRWLGAGALLGCAALGGAWPEARLLVPIAFGFDAVLAALLVALTSQVFAAASSPLRRGGALLLALALLGAHLGVKPVRAAELATVMRARAEAHMRWALGAAVDDARAASQQWFVIAARDFTTAEILPFERAFYGHPMPRSYRMLSSSPFPPQLTRLDAYSFELDMHGGALPDSFAGSLQRPATRPLVRGDSTEAAGIHVYIDDVADGQPTRMRFVFPKPLDDPEYVFLFPIAGGVARVVIPPVGQQVQLPAPQTPVLRR